MSKGIHIASIEILEEMCLALSVFASDCRECLEESKSDIKCKIEQLEERCHARARRVERMQEAYDRADEDDDLDELAYRLREAEEEYQRARQWMHKIEEIANEYARAAVRIAEISDHQIAEACAFLRQKAEELKDYTLLQPKGVSKSLSGSVGTVVHKLHSVTRDASQERETLTNFVLPQGFRWVELNKINPREISTLPTRDEYKKVPYEEMVSGLRILKNEVLPAVKELGDQADADYFYQIDKESGRDSQNGARQVFSAFFGRSAAEYIRLERYADTQHYDITNGRHRIRVALDLGWDAVPAEVVEIQRKQ